MRLASLVLLAVASVVLVGCGGGGGHESSGLPNSASYKLVNASPDSANLEVRVNGSVKTSNLAYGAASESFLKLQPGTYDVGLRPAGDAVDAWTEAVTLGPNESDVLAAVGLANFGEEFEKRLRLADLRVDRTALNGNKSRLILLNAFVRETGFDQVPVDFKNPGDNPQITFSDIAFGEAQSLDVDSGPQSFEFRLSGADEVQASGDLNLQPGKIYLAILSGVEHASGVQAPQIRVVELQAI